MDKIEKVSVNGQVYELAGSGGSASDITNITYEELKELVAASGLVPGSKYRITDFVSIYIEGEVYLNKSAGHQFDIIVTAKTNSELYSQASAALHEGDDYFSNCDLSKWELKYNINSKNEIGKGEIYYMKDEFDNEANYDFKNCLFKIRNTNSKFLGDTTEIYAYTFSFLSADFNDIKDFSITGKVKNNSVYNYKITGDTSNGAIALLCDASSQLLASIENNKINGAAVIYAKATLPFIKNNAINGFANINIPTSKVKYMNVTGGIDIDSDVDDNSKTIEIGNVIFNSSDNPVCSIIINKSLYIKYCTLLSDGSTVNIPDNVDCKTIICKDNTISYFPEN